MVVLQVVVTEKCNLGCSYCYMSNRNVFMSEETFVGFYKSLLSDQDYRLDFFGGEPLMNWELITFITNLIKNDKRFKSITLPSNALLLSQDKVDFIRHNSIGFSWSCDGINTDSVRKHVDGHGTLDRYLNVLSLIKQLTSTSNVMISPDNLNILENFHFFRNTFGLEPVFKVLKEGWGASHVNVFAEEYGKYIDFCIDRFKHERIMSKDVMRMLNIVIDGLGDSKAKPRCIDGERVCVFPDGRVGFCARMCTGGNFATEFGEYGDYYSECVNCDITSLCDKGCLVVIDGQKGMNKNLCDIYRVMFGEVIRLNHELSDDMVWSNNILRRYFNDAKRRP